MDESSRSPRRRTEGGAVTAETAVLLPILAVLLIAGMWVVGVVLANVRCIDAARDAARAVARGETTEVAVELGSRAAPPGAEIEISRDGSEVEVVVSATVKPDWSLLGGLPAVKVAGRSVVQVEPGVPGPARPGSPSHARSVISVRARPGVSGARSSDGVPGLSGDLEVRIGVSDLARSGTPIPARPAMPMPVGAVPWEVYP